MYCYSTSTYSESERQENRGWGTLGEQLTEGVGDGASFLLSPHLHLCSSRRKEAQGDYLSLSI